MTRKQEMTINLPKAGGTLTLTISRTFRVLSLHGAERELVTSIIDQMRAFRADQVHTSLTHDHVEQEPTL